MNGSKALIDFKEYSRYSNTKEKEDHINKKKLFFIERLKD